MLSALGKEQVKCKENPVSKNIPMTLSNIQLLAVRGAGGWLGRGQGAAAPPAPGSVGRHIVETTEINRDMEEWTEASPAGPVPAARGLCLLTWPIPASPAPCLTPQRRGTDAKHPADRLQGKDYNVGWERGGEAREAVQSARAAAALSTRPGLPVDVPQSHRPRGVQILPGGRERRGKR